LARNSLPGIAGFLGVLAAMMKNIVVGFFAAQALYAGSPEITLNYRYTDAQSSRLESQEISHTVDTTANFVSNTMLEKTVAVIKLAESCKTWLSDFKNVWNSDIGDCGEGIRPTIAVADNILAELAAYGSLAIYNSDEELAEVLDLFRKLAQNMKNNPYPIYAPEYDMAVPACGGPLAPTGSAPGRYLGISTGGAQDFAYVRKLINDGLVPSPEDFDTKGFLSEFELNPELACDKLICVEPIYKIDALQKKLFVQIAMNSALKESDFIRKPLNLALVIDISGSMDALDNTEKSRLEWAKDAAIKAVTELNHFDALSIVVFDTESEVLLGMTEVSSEQQKEEIIAKIRALQSKGSTNLYAGIKSAYELVSDYAAITNNRENRVILISDAGLNTGVTDEATTISLVGDYAAEGIGLTAIGLGENFNQEFILGISKSMGGNYIYVHSGLDMLRFFESFDFLVSPVAYHFKVRVKLNNIDATFVKAYGVPVTNEEIPEELINVQTLFFTKEGGGALVLEYDLK
jgi:Mg-chelatase subunit ChlD